MAESWVDAFTSSPSAILTSELIDCSIVHPALAKVDRIVPGSVKLASCESCFLVSFLRGGLVRAVDFLGIRCPPVVQI